MPPGERGHKAKRADMLSAVHRLGDQASAMQNKTQVGTNHQVLIVTNWTFWPQIGRSNARNRRPEIQDPKQGKHESDCYIPNNNFGKCHSWASCSPTLRCLRQQGTVKPVLLDAELLRHYAQPMCTQPPAILQETYQPTR